MKIIIKKAGKKGRGVFANKNFKKGEIIIKSDYTKHRRIVTKKEFSKLSEDEQNHLDYIGKGEYVVDYSPISIVNHSCNPNCYIKYKNIKVKYLIALKDIKKGEELGYDLAIDAKDDNWKMKCYCGNANCRKIIYSSWNKLPENLKKGYWKIVPIWKKRLLNRQK